MKEAFRKYFRPETKVEIDEPEEVDAEMLARIEIYTPFIESRAYTIFKRWLRDKERSAAPQVASHEVMLAQVGRRDGFEEVLTYLRHIEEEIEDNAGS